MWHYLYFTVLVKVKDPTEFTGPESYVHEMVKVKIIEKRIFHKLVFLLPSYICHNGLNLFYT